MSTVKIVLRPEKRKDNTYPLAIRITKDRKSSFIYLPYTIPLNDWNPDAQRVKKTHPNHSRLNNFLIKRLSEATNISLDVDTEKRDSTSSTVKQRIKPTGSKTFFGQADIYLANLKTAGKRNQYSADKPRLNAFKAFVGNADLPFSEINPTLLKRFKAYLKYDADKKPRTERTIINHLIPIRTVFNLAIQSGLTEQKYYPFGKGKLVIKFPQSVKIGLDMDEVRKIESLPLPAGSALNHARNVWLFTFYMAGMRISDALRLTWADFHDDRLSYKMGKNGKVDSLKVPEKAAAILNQYKRENPKHNLVFPDLESLQDLNDTFTVQGRITQKAKRINELLPDIAKKCGISKKLTNHISRHTFGNISGDRIPLQMLQKLYRHTDIKTTINYQQNFIHKDADDALAAVIQ